MRKFLLSIFCGLSLSWTILANHTFNSNKAMEHYYQECSFTLSGCHDRKDLQGPRYATWDMPLDRKTIPSDTGRTYNPLNSYLNRAAESCLKCGIMAGKECQNMSKAPRVCGVLKLSVTTQCQRNLMYKKNNENLNTEGAIERAATESCLEAKKSNGIITPQEQSVLDKNGQKNPPPQGQSQPPQNETQTQQTPTEDNNNKTSSGSYGSPFGYNIGSSSLIRQLIDRFTGLYEGKVIHDGSRPS